MSGSGFYIQNNLSAIYAHRQLTITNFRVEKSLERLSSGYRINRSGDDAAGLAVSEKLRTQVNGLDQASRNIMDGISLIQTAEGGLEELHLILQRMRTLAIQAANDTYTTGDRLLIQVEIDQLLQEIERMQTTVVFNTRQLLTGAYAQGVGSMQLHVGANYQQTLSLHIGSMSAAGLDLLGLQYRDEAGQLTGNAGYTTQASAESAINIISDAINVVSSTRADLGAKQNRLQHTYNFVRAAMENMQASESRIRDTDMAAEMTEFTKSQILLQAGNAMLAQANLKTQSVLQLLQ